MAAQELGPFRGIDARPGAADKPGALAEAKNVIVGSDGSLVRRPALVWRASLPADSVGIYGIGDQLRTLANYNTGDETSDDVLAPTIYVDYMTDPTPKTVTQLLGWVQGSDGRTIALVRYNDSSTAMHRCPEVSTPPASETPVETGFTPDFALLRAAGRAWVLDGSLRYMWHSSLDSATPDKLVDFASDTDLSSGSGPVEVSQFTTGAGAPQGLAMFGGRIVVLYRSALLIYRIDVDKFRLFLEQQITGPGTSAPRSAVELGADTIFLSDAGVRVISTVMQTLDAREDAIGGRQQSDHHPSRPLRQAPGVLPAGVRARRAVPGRAAW